MFLHRGGLNAAWAAAMGARSGQDATEEVKAHLRAHRKALGLDRETASMDEPEQESRELELSGMMTRVFDVPIAATPAKLAEVASVVAERHSIHLLVEPKATTTAAAKPRFYEVQGATAIIPVYGSLVAESGMMRPVSGMTGYDGISKNLNAAMEDPTVERVAFDIDSNGGEVSGLFDLVDEIMSFRGIKPMRAVVKASAYSAAYAIAAAADEIVMAPSAGVGSVGVIAIHLDKSKAMDAAGVKPTIVTAGAHKADFSEYQPLEKAALERLQKHVNESYAQFVDFVAKARRMTTEKVMETQALTYNGEHAVAIGFADAVVPMTGAMSLVETDIADVAVPEKHNAKETLTMPWNRLCERLSLQIKETDEANEEQVVALFKHLTAKAAETDRVAEFLKLHGVASLDELTAKIQGLVPAEELAKARAKLLEIAAVSRVAELMQPPNAKISEAFKPWAIEFYMRDKEGFEKIVAGMPNIVPGGVQQKVETENDKAGGGAKIDKEERAALEAQFGKERVAEVLSELK